MKRLGVHTSILGGIHFSLERARKLGCNTIQIFSHNPRQWKVKRISEKDVIEFKIKRKNYEINPIYIHTSYLINLASLDSCVLKKSIDLLIEEMDLADLLGADYVILHIGRASDRKVLGRKVAIESLKIVSKKKKWNARLLLENTSGQRGDISSYMNEIGELINEVGDSLIGGVCIDTCHAFAAGYQIDVEEGLTRLVEEIKLYIGLEKVRLIHLNDSKKGHSSFVDRHEHIGMGKIGREGLKRLINHSSLRDIPLILETPKRSEADDKRNLKIVRSLMKEN